MAMTSHTFTAHMRHQSHRNWLREQAGHRPDRTEAHTDHFQRLPPYLVMYSEKELGPDVQRKPPRPYCSSACIFL